LLFAFGHGNRAYHLPAFPGVIIKDSCWRWPKENRSGNAIDFFTVVLGLSFHDALRELLA
jgi:hypothetical protein